MSSGTPKREGTRKAPGTDLTLTSPLLYVVFGDPKGSRWETLLHC